MVQRIKGVGPKKKEALHRLGIDSVVDLVLDFPHRYEDRSQVVDVVFALPDARVVVCGEVSRKYTRIDRLYVTVLVGLTKLSVIFFRGQYLSDKLEIGRSYYFYGKIQNNTMFNPDFSDREDPDFLCVLPIYHLTEGYTQKEARRFHRDALELVASQDLLPENLPAAVLDSGKFMGRMAAIRSLHRPNTLQEVKEAQRRIQMEDLFLMQLRLLLENRRVDCPPMKIERSPQEDFVRLDFPLTKDQKSAIVEIQKDLTSGKVMRRMIQGDVGSGKSVVAFFALRMAAGRHQALMLAPTRILADQLYEGYVSYFGKEGVGLLHSGIPKSDRVKLQAALRCGDVRILFGTHAVLQENIAFQDLQLVVTDEQQRFGVVQRASILDRATVAHSLYLTATPIPRTLAMTLLGLRNLSLIHTIPKGRKPIRTRFVPNEKARPLIDFIKSRLKSGEQAYFVVPAIDEGGVTAEKLQRRLKSRLPEFEIGILHGEMRDQIPQVMADFRDGKIDVLVATTVIEVGVNVPNATIMVIMESHRFGLSQLHQLRGRVGRGDKQSYCFLMSNQNFADRLEILVQSHDGLTIAEEDLEQRGAGAFFGSEQHGKIPVRFPFRMEDIETANRWAQDLIAKAEAGVESAIDYIEKRREEWDANYSRNEARNKA